MKYEVTYKKIIDANSKEQAISEVNENIKKFGASDLEVKCKAICPYGHAENQNRGTCYEQCQFRENGICTLS